MKLKIKNSLSQFVLTGLIASSAFFTFACTQSSNTNKTTNSSGVQPKTSLGTDGSSTSSDTSTDTTLASINPTTASASIDSKVNMTVSDVVNDSSILFPTLTINKVTADFIRLLRCPASYEFQTLSGKKIRGANMSSLTIVERKYAWSDATGDNRKCKIVASYINSPTYIDITPSSGSFFYVANPCVTQARSTTGQEECSYDLSFSESVISYENTLIDKIRDQAIALSKDQAILNAAIDDVRITAKKLENSINACQEYFAFTETQKSIRSGLIMLGINIVGSVLGGVLFGPNGAIMVGMMTQLMGAEMLKPLLGLETGFDTCLSGEESVAQQGLTDQKAIDKARQFAQMYEEKFNVRETINHLTTLLADPQAADPSTTPPTPASPGGTIAQAIARMKKTMDEMHALDARITSANVAVAKGNKFVEKIKEQPANSDGTLPFDISSLFSTAQ